MSWLAQEKEKRRHAKKHDKKNIGWGCHDLRKRENKGESESLQSGVNYTTIHFTHVHLDHDCMICFSMDSLLILHVKCKYA